MRTHIRIGLRALFYCLVIAVCPCSAQQPPPPRPVAQTEIAPLQLAIEDLVATFGAEYTGGADYLARLKTLRPADRAGFEALKREALLANPLLDFEKILVIKRRKGKFLANNWLSNSALPKTGHENKIALVNIRKPDETSIVYRPANGVFVGDVDLHWDATRMLFSSIGSNNAWQVMEIGIDGKDLRQITQTTEPFINNYDACYLPDGRILFSSTAPMAAVPCINGGSPIACLFRCNADGTAMEQLCFDQEHNWCPQVMADGRILYLRWEYTDLPHSNSRILMTMNPDGTNQRAHYGSSSWWPNGIFYARQIPGRPSMFVGIVTGHHGVRREGEMILFDTDKGDQNADGAVQRIPGAGKTVNPVVADRLADRSPDRAIHPFPLGRDSGKKGAAKYFLSCFKHGGGWGVFLVDIFDNRLFICDGVEPVPVRKTPVPPVIPDRIRPGDSEATVFVGDVYFGPGLEGIPRGTVKELRLFTYTYGFTRGMAGLYGVIGMDGPWDMRRMLGTVPVEEDGSASFKVPANTPISIQPLDEEGKALQIMRSWFIARPGESLSCVGCHESPGDAPPPKTTMASGKAPARIRPWHGPVRNYEFVREVQPVLDAYCASCHASSKPVSNRNTIAYGDGEIPYLGGDIKIAGYRTQMKGNGGGNAGHFSVAYFNLFRHTRHSGIESDMQLQTPMEFHADTTELIAMLEKGHPSTGPVKVRLRDEHMNRLTTWIDLNRPFYGRWSQRAGDRALQAEAQRQEMRKRYAGIDENHEQLPPPFVIDPVPPVAVTKHKNVEFVPQVGPIETNTSLVIHLSKGLDLQLTYVPSGEFAIGSTRERDEGPMSRVVIKDGFWLSRFEISNQQFKLFDPAHSSRREDRHGYQFGVESYSVGAPDQPVVRVSWKQANAFCKWLSAKTGKKVRLPTEAEWEWACRAGTTTPMNYGAIDADFAKHGNMADSMLHHFSTNPYAKDWRAAVKNPQNIYDNWIPQIASVNDGSFLSVPGGRYEPNKWGLHDMHGNVAEWTASLHRPYPYKHNDGRNDNAASGRRVVRGGSWRDRPKHCTSSARRAYQPFHRVYNVGFRVTVLQ